MPPPPTDRLRVVRYAPGWGFAAGEWARAFDAIDWSVPHADDGPLRLKIRTKDRDCTVWRAGLLLPGGSREVVIKVEPLLRARKRLQSMLRRTKSFRQWRGAELLEKKGFRAARGLAILRAHNGAIPCDILVLESLPGKTVLEHLAEGGLSVREEHAVARALGDLNWALEGRTSGNGDAKLSNIVVLDPKPPTAKLALVDTTDIGKRFLYLDMYAIQYIEALGCGLAPRRSLWARAITATDQPSDRITAKKRKRWKRYIDSTSDYVSGIVEKHGDPTPTDNPLARG